MDNQIYLILNIVHNKFEDLLIQKQQNCAEDVFLITNFLQLLFPNGRIRIDGYFNEWITQYPEYDFFFLI